MNIIKTLYSAFIKSSGIATDSREEVKNSLFFALSGENFNGNRFAEAALNKGAALAVIDDPLYKKDERYFLVNNTLETLQQLALHHRKQFNIPVFGITGTNGKTTTKELVTAVLQTTFKTVATKGNLNNHIGVPLTLLGISSNTEIAVVEMGANHPGEIRFLCHLALPTHGIITNIGKAHLEGFGNFEGVKNTKKELFDFLEVNKGLAFVNADDPLLINLSEKLNRYTYGTSNSIVKGKIIKQQPHLKIEISTDKKNITVSSQLYGSYNFPNMMAAAAVGNYFNVPGTSIREALENYIPTNNRSQQIKTAHNHIILDAYNANPVSMANAINSFKEAKFENECLILGDMFELGSSSAEEHQKVASLLIQKGFRCVYLIGESFAKTTHPFTNFITTQEAGEFFTGNPLKGKTILLKGSRGMHLETLLELL